VALRAQDTRGLSLLAAGGLFVYRYLSMGRCRLQQAHGVWWVFFLRVFFYRCLLALRMPTQRGNATAMLLCALLRGCLAACLAGARGSAVSSRCLFWSWVAVAGSRQCLPAQVVWELAPCQCPVWAGE